MEIKPLIHSRTENCDFNPNFLVHSNDIETLEIMKKLKFATDNIDDMKTNRNVIFTHNDYIIFGLICKFQDIINDCVNEKEKYELEVCRFDKNGRINWGFLGFSMPINNSKNIPCITTNDYIKLIKDNILPIWKQTVNESKIVEDTFELQFKEVNNSNKSPFEKYNLNVCQQSNNNNKEAFDYCFYQAINGKDVFYCSNVSYITAKNKPFTHITTDSNSILRFKKDFLSKSNTINKNITYSETKSNDAFSEFSDKNKEQKCDKICSKLRKLNPTKEELDFLVELLQKLREIKYDFSKINNFDVDKLNFLNIPLGKNYSKNLSLVIYVKEDGKNET